MDITRRKGDLEKNFLVSKVSTLNRHGQAVHVPNLPKRGSSYKFPTWLFENIQFKRTILLRLGGP